MRVLITGITGMAGSFLAEYLADHHPGVDRFAYELLVPAVKP